MNNKQTKSFKPSGRLNSISSNTSNIPRPTGHKNIELSLPDGLNDFVCLLFLLIPQFLLAYIQHTTMPKRICKL